VKFIPGIATGRPVLDEETFQRLLAAAHIMQECNDPCVDKSTVDSACLSDSTIAGNAQPIQVVSLASSADVAQDVIPRARTDVEPLVAQRDSLIPPETACQLVALASQLQVALADIRTHSGWKTRPPAALVAEISPEGQRTFARHVGIQEEASFEHPTSEPRQLIPLLQSAVPSEAGILPRKVLRRRISQSRNLFLESATMVAIVALLGALLHHFSILPGGLALSTYSTATQVVSEVQSRIRADRRLPMTRVQVRASNGIVTLSGNVGSGAERVAALQDAADNKGVRVVVDNLRVIGPDPQGPTAARQASVARTASRSNAPTIPRAGAFHAAVPANSLRLPALSESIGAGRSRRTTGVGASASSPAVVTPLKAPEQITLPYGTVLAVRMKESVSSDFNQRGDIFLASLASPVMVEDRIVIPADAAIQGKIVEVRNVGRFNGRSTLVVTVTRLAYNGRSYDLRSSQYSNQGVSRSTHTVAAIAGGAGMGAIIGVILGGEKGAAIGAMIGAGVGTGAQAIAKVRLPANSMLSFRLETPLTVVPSSTLLKNAGRKLGTSRHGVDNG